MKEPLIFALLMACLFYSHYIAYLLGRRES